MKYCFNNVIGIKPLTRPRRSSMCLLTGGSPPWDTHCGGNKARFPGMNLGTNCQPHRVGQKREEFSKRRCERVSARRIYCLCWVASGGLTLFNPTDCSPPGSSVHGILQATREECVVVFFSRGSSQPRDRTHVSEVSCTGRQVLYH